VSGRNMALFEEATKSLLRQDLSRQGLQELLRSTNSAIRGAAILECLDHPTVSRTQSLRAVLSWTENLPRARSRGKAPKDQLSPQAQ